MADTSMNSVDMIAVIIGALAVLAIVVLLICLTVRGKKQERIQNSMTAPETVHAVLTAQETERIGGKKLFTLVFRTDDGRTVRIRMDQQAYDAFKLSAPTVPARILKQHLSLTLTYRGTEATAYEFDPI